MHYHAKFHQNRSDGSGDMVIFWFFKMAAVHYLEFVGRILGPSTISTWRSISSGKIWLESMYSFCNILHVWLGNAYSCPKIGVLGRFNPLNGDQYQCNPKEAHPCMETRRMMYKSLKLCMWLRNKKKKKDPNSGKLDSPRPPTYIIVSRYGFAWWVAFGWYFLISSLIKNQLRGCRCLYPRLGRPQTQLAQPTMDSGLLAPSPPQALQW